MAKVLIVDDERETREGLVQFIDWKDLKIEKVVSASGGKEAVRIASSFCPDIVISDIRMPDMDGLELCAKLRSFSTDCQIIFISAYAEKEYFKKAICLQAVDYVEKPINLEELHDAVRTAVERIHVRTAQEVVLSDTQRHMVWELLLSGIFSGHFTGDIEEEFHRVKLFENQEQFFTALILKVSEESAEIFDKNVAEKIIKDCFEEESVLVIQKNERYVIAVLGAEQKDKICEHSQKWERFMKRVEAPDSAYGLFCAVGSCESSRAKIRDSYQNAVIALQELFHVGYGQMRFYHVENSKDCRDYFVKIEDQKKKFKNYADQKEIDMTKAVLRELYGSFRQIPSCNHMYIRREYEEMLRILLEHQSVLTDEDRRAAIGRIREFDTLKEIHKNIIEMSEKCLQMIEGNPFVHQVIVLIEKRYAEEDLSVQKLADAVFITDSYLSRIFKQETGKTVGKYITDVRIKHAKELLMDQGLKLYHISMLVGYSNPGYFAKIFKRNVGIMPSEYRSRKIK